MFTMAAQRMNLSLEGWVLYACVVDDLEFLLEDFLGGIDVLEGDGALCEESFGNLGVDDAVNEL